MGWAFQMFIPLFSGFQVDGRKSGVGGTDGGEDVVLLPKLLFVSIAIIILTLSETALESIIPSFPSYLCWETPGRPTPATITRMEEV